MRFGLSDLEELPSLKEFELLARAALGADEGIAPLEPESAAEPESLHGAEGNPDGNPEGKVTGGSGEPSPVQAIEVPKDSAASANPAANAPEPSEDGGGAPAESVPAKSLAESAS